MRFQFCLCASIAAVALLTAQGVMAAETRPQWEGHAAALVPQNYVPGQAYAVDEAAGIGHMAAFPQGADDPSHPGSAFEPGFSVTAKLNAGLGFVSGTFGPREQEPSAAEARAAFLAQNAAAGIHTTIPDDVEPCRIYGWSAVDDAQGLKVHAGPADDAAVLGTLAPPYYPPTTEIAPSEGWRSEFTIVGYKAGWFLIEGAQQPGAPYQEAEVIDPAPTYPDGWVKAGGVGAAYANTNMPVGWLLQAPNIDAAAFIPPGSENIEGLSIDGTLKTLLACSANWALTESVDGTRGWWRGICSNQATNCS